VLARVAENIYWLSRYLERAENTVRLLDVHGRTLIDYPDINEHAGWIALISINALDESFAKKYQQATEQSVCDFLLADTDNPGSLVNAFIAVQNNLRSCRDIVPRSSYEAINSACRYVHQQLGLGISQYSQRQVFLNNAKMRLLAISGDINSNMSNDVGYQFMRMGCNIERADMTSRIIDVQSSRLAGPHANDELIPLQWQRWMSVLKTLSALQMYRQHVHKPVDGHSTLEFLLHNARLPRSYQFCIDRLETTLLTLKRNTEPLSKIKSVRRQLASADLQLLAEQPLMLHQFIDSLQLSLQSVANVISETYFPPQET
jgi:uncharacterized alpha-E superfamily protein